MSDLPDKGPAGSSIAPEDEYCPRCRNVIPSFAQLDEKAANHLREMAIEHPVEAMRELRAKTGCSLSAAKIWVLHPRGPHAAKIHPPCPFCGTPLFSTGTRQCLKCNWDWHDEKIPRRLKANNVPDGETFSTEEARDRLRHWLVEHFPEGSQP